MRDTILLVDSSANRREMLCGILGDDYNILEASSIEQADFLLKQNFGALISVVLDIDLLMESGEAFLDAPEKQAVLDKLSVILITRSGSPELDVKAYDRGADAVIHWPYHPELVKKTVINILSLYSHKMNLERIVKDQKDTLRQSNEIMIDALSSIIEYRSVESGQHVLRIRHFTRILLEELAFSCPEYQLDEGAITSISGAAALHDIGKIAIPDAILNKPGRLTADEFEVMKSHSAKGSEMIEQLGGIGNDEYLRYAYNICRYHHERWDGGGYPDGLSGEDIPICAQAVGLADAFDALTTKRVYKDAYPCSVAVNMILNGECGSFSPKLLECFKHVKGEFFRLAEQYADGSVMASDRIKEPLAPPGGNSANSLHTVLSKYEILLHYLNATVIEIDLESNTFHTVCNPDPAMSYLNYAGNLDQAMAMMAQHSVHPDDRSMITDQFHEYLEMFIASGLRRSVRRYRLRGIDGVYRYYNVTSFRVGSDENSKKVIGIWDEIRDGSSESNAAGSPAQKAEAENEPLIGRSLFEIPQIARFDRWFTFGEITEEFCTLVGYTPEELKKDFHNHLIECVLPESRRRFYEQISSQLSHDHSFLAEFPLIKKDGGVVWVLGKGALVTGSDGFEYICGSMTDISILRAASGVPGAVWSKEDHLQYFDRSGDILFAWDALKDQLAVSPNWNEKYGYAPIKEQASIRMLSGSHFHPDDMSSIGAVIDALKGGRDFVEFTARIANKNGRYVSNLIRVCAKRDERGSLIKMIGRFVEISEESGISVSQKRSGSRDLLTGLPGRDAARMQIEAHLGAMNADAGEKHISALAIIDLDNFKEINDRYGHLFGDAVLTRIALEISGLLRSTDLVARIGGDEFLVYIPDIPQKELVVRRSGQIIERVEAVFDGKLAGCGFACSVGIAFAPDHGTAYQELFQHADHALYQAKRSGKSCCRVYDPMALLLNMASLPERTEVDSDLQPKWTESSLPGYVFDTLYESGDVMETVNSLLAVVGRQSGVSRVYIFENNADNTACSNTFEWCAEGVSSEKDNLQNISYETDIPDYEHNFNERGIFYCGDTAELPDHLRAILEPQGIKSMLHCAIREGGVFRGYVGFDDITNTRFWTQDQIDLLTFLSKIISLFVLKQRAQNETNAMLEGLRDVLNSQYSWVYVIDPETYELRFLNDRTKVLVPDAHFGMCCYKTLMNRDKPCENCPMQHPSHAADIYNDYLNLHVSATAGSIWWQGKKEWLITCTEKEL